MDIRGLLAGPETLMSVGSGMLAQPLSGLAGLLALPAGPERAANAVKATQERLTYQPQTQQGQRMVGALGGLLAPVSEAWTGLQKAVGDTGYALGGPLVGALGQALPDAAAMAIPAAMAARRAVPQAFPLPNQSQAGAVLWHDGPMKAIPAKEFYDKYFMHVDVRNRGNPDSASAAMKAISSDGFNSHRVNLLPIQEPNAPQNIMSKKYAPQDGDAVYLVPKDGRQSTYNGSKVRDGWKPAEGEFFIFRDNGKSLYEQYVDAISGTGDK